MHKVLVISSLYLLFIILTPALSEPCKVCHSKNPGMVVMHEDPRNKACFNCHGKGQILPSEQLREQMDTDNLCVECHGIKNE